MMRIRNRLLLASVVLAALALGVAGVLAHADETNQDQATAVLHNIDGAEVGQATFTQQDEGRVEVHVEVHDLLPGFHGFHVHAKGVCDPTADVNGIHFSSAKGHLALKPGQVHPHHSGDLPSLLVNDDGTGQATTVTDRFTITDLFINGTALIIHAGPDNFANIPTRYRGTLPLDAKTNNTGDSGDRVACGVIQSENNSDQDSADIVSSGVLVVLRAFFDSAKLVTRLLTFPSPSLPT